MAITMIEVGDEVKFKSGEVAYTVVKTGIDFESGKMSIDIQHPDGRIYEGKRGSKLDIVKKGDRSDSTIMGVDYGDMEMRLMAQVSGNDQVSKEYVDDLTKRLEGMFSLPPQHINCRSITIPMEDIMKNVIEKLNNLIVEDFDQPVIEEKTIKLSLLAVLKESPLVKKMNLGEDAILRNLRVEGDKIVLDLAVGDVVYVSPEKDEE